MLDYIKLHRVGPAEQMEFEFGKRLNVLTGDNGLGKSFILDIAWWALTRTWAKQPARPRITRDMNKPVSLKKPTIEYHVYGKSGAAEPATITYTPAKKPEDAWRLRRGRPPRTGLIIYARVDGGYSVWDPSRNYYINAPSVGFVEPDRAPAFHFTSDQLWDGLEIEGTPYCNGLIKDWETWETRKPELFDQFTAVMGELSRGMKERLVPGKYVRLDLADARELPTINLPYDQVPVTLLSSAMRRVLSLAYLLVWAWEEHKTAAIRMNEMPTDTVILLIDEIESHLHPQWQRIILPALLDAVSKLNDEVKTQVIAVTHSPLVLASLESRFDERTDKLFKFDLDDDDDIVIDEMNWHPLGEVSDWLTSDVFDLGEARSIEAEKAIERAMEELAVPGLDIQQRRAIHHRLHKVLGENDPYWVNWVIQAKSAGIKP